MLTTGCGLYLSRLFIDAKVSTFGASQRIFPCLTSVEASVLEEVDEVNEEHCEGNCSTVDIAKEK